MMVQMCASFRYRNVKTQFLLLPPELLPPRLLRRLGGKGFRRKEFRWDDFRRTESILETTNMWLCWKRQVFRHPYWLGYLYGVTKALEGGWKKEARRKEFRRKEFRRKELRKELILSSTKTWLCWRRQVLWHPYCLCYLYLVTKLPMEARRKGFRRREFKSEEFRRTELSLETTIMWLC